MKRLILLWITLFICSVSSVKADLDTIIVYWKYNQAVTVFDTQVKTMYKKWYKLTKILDLLALKSMECNRYDWLCYWHYNLDLGPYQINKIHIEQYNVSYKFMKEKKLWELFNYQLEYANWLIDSYEKRFCGKHIFDYIWRTYTNKRRFQCVAKSYNWSPRYKYMYGMLLFV